MACWSVRRLVPALLARLPPWLPPRVRPADQAACWPWHAAAQPSGAARPGQAPSRRPEQQCRAGDVPAAASHAALRRTSGCCWSQLAAQLSMGVAVGAPKRCACVGLPRQKLPRQQEACALTSWAAIASLKLLFGQVSVHCRLRRACAAACHTTASVPRSTCSSMLLEPLLSVARGSAPGSGWTPWPGRRQ